MERHYYTFDEIFNALNNAFNSESPISDTPTPQKQSVGNIYSPESIQQAISQYENELQDDANEYERKRAEKQKKLELLRNKLELEKNKSKLIRKGSDVAITMTRDNAAKLLEQLANLMNCSNAERITFNIPNISMSTI